MLIFLSSLYCETPAITAWSVTRKAYHSYIIFLSKNTNEAFLINCLGVILIITNFELKTYIRNGWCFWLDLNQRPPRYQHDALTNCATGAYKAIFKWCSALLAFAFLDNISQMPFFFPVCDKAFFRLRRPRLHHLSCVQPRQQCIFEVPDLLWYASTMVPGVGLEPT